MVGEVIYAISFLYGTTCCYLLKTEFKMIVFLCMYHFKLNMFWLWFFKYSSFSSNKYEYILRNHICICMCTYSGGLAHKFECNITKNGPIFIRETNLLLYTFFVEQSMN